MCQQIIYFYDESEDIFTEKEVDPIKEEAEKVLKRIENEKKAWLLNRRRETTTELDNLYSEQKTSKLEIKLLKKTIIVLEMEKNNLAKQLSDAKNELLKNQSEKAENTINIWESLDEEDKEMLHEFKDELNG